MLVADVPKSDRCQDMCNWTLLLLTYPPHFNSSLPSVTYILQWIGLALVQIMVCRLFGAKPLSQPMLCNCQLDLWEYTSHSVESPSMVDPQWDIWYWGSKWNLHTVCWSAVGCEWGTTSVYFGITYVCFVPSRLPVFAVEPQYLLQDFLFLSKVSFEGHIQNL